MAISSPLDAPTANAGPESHHGSSPLGPTSDQQLWRWGGVAGIAGGTLIVGAGVVVGALGLPDASDVETLTDFADIESGRIAEHFLYLGGVVLLALHVLVLHRMLRTAHQAAALFGAAIAEFGLLIMAASSMLHVSTSPLADLYTEPGASTEDLRSIEHAWYGAQSVWDTMLATGVLLVPIGIVLLGVAMRSAPEFGTGLTMLAVVLGAVGIVGATIAVVDPGSMFSALSVLAIVVFHLSTGWRTLQLGRAAGTDDSGEPAPIG